MLSARLLLVRLLPVCLLICLLTCLLPLPLAADPTADDAARLHEGYRHLAEESFTDAIEAFTDVIEASVDDPERQAVAAQAYAARAQAHLQCEQWQLALDDADAAIAREPHSVLAWMVRVYAHERLGNLTQSEADQQHLMRVIAETSAGESHFAGSGFGEPDFADPPHSPIIRALARWTLVVLAWALTVIAYVLVGNRQRREGGGTWGRLLWVSAALAALAALPMSTWAVAATIWPEHEQQVIAVMVGATLFGAVIVGTSLQPPVRVTGSSAPLPLVEDERLLVRVAEIAGRMRLPVPRVRLLRSADGTQSAMAFVGGLPAPSLVVSDGILQRLSSVERDAVIAHELGHLANRSLWLFAAVIPLSGVAATVLASFVPDMLAPLAIGFAVWTGLRRIVNRLLELDCDRRAARAIGFRDTASALVKIHAVHDVANEGWLSLLTYATATHPSRAIRLWSLHRSAPADDRPDFDVPAVEIRRHRLAAAAAVLLWIVALAASVWLARRYPGTQWPSALPVAVMLTPPALFLAALWRKLVRARRRLGKRFSPAGWLTFAAAVTAVAWLYPTLARESGDPMLWSGLGAFFALPVAVGAITLVVFLNRGNRLKRELTVAFLQHDFARYLQIGRAHAKAVARDPALRHDVGMITAIVDDRPAGLAALEQLRSDKPRFAQATLTLSLLYLDQNDNERALAIAEDAAGRLRDDPAPLELQARALRRLGRSEEARAAVDAALAIEPQEASLLAVAAALALDRGDLSEATRLIDDAQRHGPGDPFVLWVRAQVSLASDPPDAARAAVVAALQAVRAQALSLMAVERAELEQSLATLDREHPQTAAEPVFDDR